MEGGGGGGGGGGRTSRRQGEGRREGEWDTEDRRGVLCPPFAVSVSV